MTLSEMRRLLELRGLRLTKSLGQNFLHDGNQLRRIVATAELNPDDQILEIGPGLGPLTELLLASGAAVLAVETDARLCHFLRERFATEPRLELVHADALKWLRESSRRWGDWKVVANLPYSVGSPILVELALTPEPPQCLVVTLQLEVVRRLAAAPDTDDYGVLTLLVGLQFEVAGWFKIPRDCFFPVPEVDSACIHLKRRRESLLPQSRIPRFAALVKAAFSQRRKMLRNLLRDYGDDSRLDSAFRSAGISNTARAETLSLSTFVALTQALHSD